MKEILCLKEIEKEQLISKEIKLPKEAEDKKTIDRRDSNRVDLRMVVGRGKVIEIDDEFHQ